MGRTDDDGWQFAAPPAAAPSADLRGPACVGGLPNMALVARLQDVRTALNAIRGFSELMLAGGAGPLSADGLDYIRQIAAAGRMLEDALSLAATEDRPP